MPLAALLVQAHVETVLTEVGRPTKEAGWGGKGARGRGAEGEMTAALPPPSAC